MTPDLKAITRASAERGAVALEAWAAGSGPPHDNWREVSGALAKKMRALIAGYDWRERGEITILLLGHPDLRHGETIDD